MGLDSRSNAILIPHDQMKTTFKKMKFKSAKYQYIIEKLSKSTFLSELHTFKAITTFLQKWKYDKKKEKKEVWINKEHLLNRAKSYHRF